MIGRPSKCNIVDGSGIARPMQPGDGWIADLAVQNISTVGAGIITADNLEGGLILRTAAGAAVTDTIDTAANIGAQFSNLNLGDSIVTNYINGTGFAITIAGGIGVTMQTPAANNVIAVSGAAFITLVCTQAPSAPTSINPNPVTALFNCYIG